MLSISEKANTNYLAKVVDLKNIKKHPNADRLQTVDIDFNTVITGMDAKEGDTYVYFPIECKINKDFLSETNSFRDKELNSDKEQMGFFEENCRVRAMRLRGEKSMGYIVPISVVFNWAYGKEPSFTYSVGDEFDTINGLLLLEKYVIKKNEPRVKQGKKPKVSRLIEGQVHLHVDTENLRKNADKIKPSDTISITYKTYGISWWVGNVLVKKNLSWLYRILDKLGLNIDKVEYDHVYGSRRVVKNEALGDPKAKDHFYGYDLWEDIKEEVRDCIPKGYTLYGEMLGFDKNGAMIQNGFDYGCKEGEHKLEVYRITHTTPDGLVTELSYPQIAQFCEKVGLTPSYLFYYGKASDWFEFAGLEEEVMRWDDINFSEVFVRALEKVYNEKDCFMCVNKVPEEGIVVRKESLFDCESYKLKSFNFLDMESKSLDKGESDLESEN
ncbi:MAG: hypothetical protein KDH96_01465 [Candidatus Riesia sp.]|nr:hypothetical protein [Candidatus Riesia sp.]